MRPMTIMNKLNEASDINNYINRFNELRKEYTYGRDKNVDYAIKSEIIDILNELPSGTTFYKNYKETVSGYTSWGGYHDEYATIIEFKKDGNDWLYDGVPRSLDDIYLGIIHSNSDMRSKEDAEKVQKEMKKDLKSTHTPYAPKSTVDRDNPYWDGNRYGI